MAHFDLDEWYDEPAPKAGGKAFVGWEYRMSQPGSKPRWKLSEFRRLVWKPQPNVHQRVHAEDEFAYALQFYKARSQMKSVHSPTDDGHSPELEPKGARLTRTQRKTKALQAATERARSAEESCD